MTNTFSYFLVYLMQIVSGERKNMETFVVGGGHPNIKEHPHAALVSANCGAIWICGSSVLNQQILITAAHCLEGCTPYKSKPHRIMAILGHENKDEATVVRLITNYVVHKKYNEKTCENDIGLLLLEKVVTFGDTVKRIIVARKFPEAGHEGKIAGWGLTENKRTSKVLRDVYQQLRSIKTCSKVGKLALGMFCAGKAMQQSYPALGDSGSGLVTLKGYNLIGLVSFKNPTYVYLVVYTNATYYFNWIERNAKSMYCQI